MAVAAYNHITVQCWDKRYINFERDMYIDHVSEKDMEKVEGMRKQKFEGGWKIFSTPAKTLDDLGKLGFKVVGFVTSKDPMGDRDRIIWTMVRKTNHAHKES